MKHRCSVERRTMDAQMTCTHFSGCQDLRGRVKTQVLHSGDQLNPARVSCPTTKMKLCNNKYRSRALLVARNVTSAQIRVVDIKHQGSVDGKGI